MYSTQSNHATFWQSEKLKERSTDKCIYGRVSSRVKDDKAEGGYSYETWNVRIVGKGAVKAKEIGLSDKTNITLTEWSCHCPYDKEKDKVFPYLLISQFELREQTQTAEGGEEFMTVPDGEELPFE